MLSSRRISLILLIPTQTQGRNICKTWIEPDQINLFNAPICNLSSLTLFLIFCLTTCIIVFCHIFLKFYKLPWIAFGTCGFLCTKFVFEIKKELEFFCSDKSLRNYRECIWSGQIQVLLTPCKGVWVSNLSTCGFWSKF